MTSDASIAHYSPRMGPDTPRLRRSPSDALTSAEVGRLRQLMASAFEADDGFGDEDWEHAVGGTHYLLELGGEILAHASVVERVLEVGGRPLRTGYVEAVATDPRRQRGGHASRVMAAVNADIQRDFELGGLATGRPGFYERLGWRRWTGPTFVRTAAGLERTPDDDGGILVLTTPATPLLDVGAPISCEWRPGDAW
jgi:aminoglycoside 2'-N-acetyltransferase I